MSTSIRYQLQTFHNVITRQLPCFRPSIASYETFLVTEVATKQSSKKTQRDSFWRHRWPFEEEGPTKVGNRFPRTFVAQMKWQVLSSSCNWFWLLVHIEQHWIGRDEMIQCWSSVFKVNFFRIACSIFNLVSLRVVIPNLFKFSTHMKLKFPLSLPFLFTF